MVQYPVTHGCFVDQPLLRIMNVKGSVRAVSVGLVDQISVQIKDVLFQVALKALNVRFAPFSFSELLPAPEKIFE